MPKSDAEYLRAPNNCPVCDGSNIEGAGVDIDYGGATQQITCLTCGSFWFDVYKLAGYQLGEQ